MNTLSPAPLEFEFGANTRSILSEIISKYPVCAFNSISMGFVSACDSKLYRASNRFLIAVISVVCWFTKNLIEFSNASSALAVVSVIPCMLWVRADRFALPPGSSYLVKNFFCRLVIFTKHFLHLVRPVFDGFGINIIRL